MPILRCLGAWLVLATGVMPAQVSERVRARLADVLSADPITCTKAIVDLGNWGSESQAAVPTLARLLTNKAALQWEIRPKVSWPPPQVKEYTSPGQEAAIALAKIGGPGLDVVRSALKNEDSDIRSFAVLALGKLNRGEYFGDLAEASRDPDPRVR